MGSFTCTKCGKETETSWPDNSQPVAEVTYKLRAGEDKDGKSRFETVLHWMYCPQCGLDVVGVLENLRYQRWAGLPVTTIGEEDMIETLEKAKEAVERENARMVGSDFNNVAQCLADIQSFVYAAAQFVEAFRQLQQSIDHQRGGVK